MKFILSLAALFITTTAFAAPNCKYELNQDNYWDDASGKLTVNAIDYKCETLILGQEGNLVTACKDPFTTRENVYDFVVNFDGGEGNFFVSVGLDSANKGKYLCEGIATTR